MPTIPAEGTYSDVERSFIENSPEGMWPENQDSNFGQIRKVLCDELQKTVDKLTVLADELFVQTATAVETLMLWEQQLGVPVEPTDKSETDRRAILAPRLVYGPFTRSRRNAAVESFIAATFGESTTLTTVGVPLTAEGVTLYSGAFSLTGTYNVVEDVEDFSYDVRILDTITVDEDGLRRELDRITPAGFTYTITYTPNP